MVKKIMKLRSKAFVAFLCVLCAGLRHTATGDGSQFIMGHVPHNQIARAQHVGRHLATSRLKLAVALQPSDPSGLANLIERLYNPDDPQYHQFLSTDEFRQRYAATDADVSHVVQYFSSRGINVTNVHKNNLVVDLEADTATIENVLQTQVHDYISADGRQVHAPIYEPVFPQETAAKIQGVVGLSSFANFRAHSQRLANAANPHASPVTTCNQAQNLGYMSPARIRSAYNMSAIPVTGSSETIALFELDGYAPADINSYTACFSLTTPTLTNVLVDGATGTAGSNTGEVVLDIELAIAAAPGISKIMVYETANTDQGVLDGYSRIASDNTAKSVSTSWGSAEDQNSTSFLNSEYTIFQQMAAQGQTVFAAAGDSGAYDDTSKTTTLEVDDPGSQPYVTDVGGTTLSTTGGGAFSSESSWGTASSAAGGGGGNSIVWSKPSWQVGLNTASNKGSSTMRMVPDVSLNGNPATGYPIYVSGAWQVYGGTSCAAPLWAGFMALVNQGRVNASLARIGFLNPIIYRIAQSSAYSTAFHDISDGTTNLYFPAVGGYDLSTGWGSFNGVNLYNSLVSSGSPPSTPTGVSVQVIK